MQMERATLPGVPPLEITLRPSARLKRFSLRVSRTDGRVTLSFPARASRAAALDFAREKERWLRQTLAGLPEQRQVSVGGSVLFEGCEVPLVAAPLRRARMEGGVLLVPPGRRAGAACATWLREAAFRRLDPVSRDYAAVLGRTPGRITMRDTRSRWGSCTSDGNLMFSWRLVMAPPEVLDYVAAHEVAHLVEMNHSRAFWALVERLVPDWRMRRDWLRRNGSILQSFRFGD